MGTSQIVELAANFKIEQQTGSSRRPRQEQGISILFQSTHAPSLVLVSCHLCSVAFVRVLLLCEFILLLRDRCQNELN